MPVVVGAFLAMVCNSGWVSCVFISTLTHCKRGTSRNCQYSEKDPKNLKSQVVT